jgi:hypothetical protein
MSSTNDKTSGLPTPLETATAAELIGELGRRSAALVVLMTPAISPSGAMICAVGNLYTCDGMLTEADHVVAELIEAERTQRSKKS